MIKFSKELVVAAIDLEEELLGQMPDEMWEVITRDRDAAAEVLRAAVRTTKFNIKRRLGLTDQ